MSREISTLSDIARAVADDEIDLTEARLHGQALGFETSTVDAAIIGFLLGLLDVYRPICASPGKTTPTHQA